jgi:hypothetical protein
MEILAVLSQYAICCVCVKRLIFSILTGIYKMVVRSLLK